PPPPQKVTKTHRRPEPGTRWPVRPSEGAVSPPGTEPSRTKANMDFHQLQSLPRMIMRQRIRPVVNQYEFRAVNPDGSEGQLLAFAQQKRLAFREQVTLYTDDSKQSPVLGFKARTVIDLGATYDVLDASGTPIGLFRKDFKQSLLRSTWHLEQPGLGRITGQERNVALAVLRRFV